ncbi:hypothetical protein CC2G_011237 [Coprinopsis cinerea AmutBmut pab1-1]|nr:hypothetical protein CC2G_011237 [Coprinopsis cinerea AmutBmut pab1-1]
MLAAPEECSSTSEHKIPGFQLLICTGATSFGTTQNGSKIYYCPIVYWTLSSQMMIFRVTSGRFFTRHEDTVASSLARSAQCPTSDGGKETKYSAPPVPRVRVVTQERFFQSKSLSQLTPTRHRHNDYLDLTNPPTSHDSTSRPFTPIPHERQNRTAYR